MSMLAIPISEDISRLFRALKFEENKRPDVADHITLFYFGDNTPLSKILKITKHLHELTKNYQPFKISTNKLIQFSEGKHGFPLVAEINSKELHKFRDEIKKIFDKNKIKYDTKFKEYNPHLTLGYTSEEIKDVKFDKIEFQVNEVALYGGDEFKENIFVSFPFCLGVKKSTNYLNLLSKKFADESKNTGFRKS